MRAALWIVGLAAMACLLGAFAVFDGRLLWVALVLELVWPALWAVKVAREGRG